MNAISRLFVISTFILATFLFAYFQKKTILKVFSQGEEQVIISQMPEFEAQDIKTPEGISYTKEHLLAENFDLYVIHFWATWCAPCEVEFPSLVELMKKFEGKSVYFLIIAINDDLQKAKKFLQRFGEVSKNVKFAFSNNNDIMLNFGTVKIPETYIFSKSGMSLRKFVGPQNWENSYYFDNISSFLK